MWGRRRSRVCRQPVRRGAKKPPHQTTAANEGCIWAPAALGSTCQGIKAPCDGLSVLPARSLFRLCSPARHPVPASRDPREEGDWIQGETDVERETVQSMRSACARDQREGTTCGAVLCSGTYRHSPHARHLHLTLRQHPEGSIRKPRYPQLSPQISIPRAQPATTILSSAFECCAGSPKIHPSAHPLSHPRPSSVILAVPVSQSVSQPASRPVNQFSRPHQSLTKSTLQPCGRSA